jgi:UDP-N-acetylglucosamine kinase
VCRLPENFVAQYFAARKVVEDLKVKFGQSIKIDLLLKNLDGTRRTYFANANRIEDHIPENFSEDDVLKIVQ